MPQRLRLLFFGVIALAAAVRLWHLDLPFIEPYNSLSRQAICATVARNFYKHGFNFFYPEIDENGSGPYLYNAEMPFYSYLMALGYRLAGGVQEWVARLVSVLFSLGTIAMLMDLLRRWERPVAAAGAGLFLALSPLYLAVSRSVQPESCMFLASVGAVWAMFVYSRSSDKKYLAVASAFAFLAVATKIYNATILFPMAYLAWKKEGFSFLKKPVYWAALAFSLLPFFWYAAMWRAGRQEPLVYDPYDFVKARGPAGKTYWELFTPHYLAFIGRTVFVHLLTPIGALLASAGFLLRRPFEGRALLRVWGVALVILFLVMWRTVLDHSYYLLPLAPFLAFFVGLGAETFWETVSQTTTRMKTFALVFITVLLAGQSMAYRHLYQGVYFIPEKTMEILEAGRQTRTRTPENALVVASYGSSTALLYYCDRKGWALHSGSDGRLLIEELEARKKEGASYFVTSRLDWFGGAEDFVRYLRGHTVLFESGDVLLVDLRQVATR